MIYNYLSVCPSSIKSWFSRPALRRSVLFSLPIYRLLLHFVYLYVCVRLLYRPPGVDPSTSSISARRLFSRNPEGHNHVFAQVLSVEAEVRLPFCERASFVTEQSRFSEQSLIGSSRRGFKLRRLPFGTIQLRLNLLQFDIPVQVRTFTKH